MRKLYTIAFVSVITIGFVTLNQRSGNVSDISARADTKDSLKHLSLFGAVFDKVRADYVDKVDERQLMENAVNGMTAWLGAQPIHLEAKQSKGSYIYMAQFSDIYDKLRGDYAGKFDERQLIEKAIDGMLTSLDSGSFLLVAKGSSEPSGNGGVGLELTKGRNFIKVVAPIDDTPSSRAGIQPGDVVAAIDGVSTEGWRIDQAAAKLRGPINSPVRLTILRGTERKKIDLKMVRESISIKSVRARHEDQDVSYIRISQFDEETAEGLRKAIAKAQEEIPANKFKGYILDLRNNPGGLLDQSIQVANAFIERGEIVSLRGRTADDTQRYIARPSQDISKGKPVVVLINGGSAGVSEIVAGTLLDHKRATIIGTRSVGSGSVQTLIPLDGTDDILRLTTSRIYTPAGRSLEAKGIEPDIVVLQDVPDEFKGNDEVKGEDDKTGSQAYVPPDKKTDKQLLAAINFLRTAQGAPAEKKPARAK